MLALLCLMFLVACAYAEDTIVNIDNRIVISDPDSQYVHILARPDIGFIDSTMVIDRAVLSFWVYPVTNDTTFISMRAYPITTDWSTGNVSWDSPWNTSGGDIDEMNYGEYAVTLPGAQEIQMDMTDLCMRWTDGRLPYFGFMIEKSSGSLDRITYLNGQGGEGPFATLTISFTRVTTQ
jgi:hypothetical protein